MPGLTASYLCCCAAPRAVKPIPETFFTCIPVSWNAPPELPTVRDQRTHVTVRFSALGLRLTHVALRHDGWGTGGEWDQAIGYFERAWGQVVLPRLRYRFEHGPIDWDQRPELGAAAL